MNQYCRRVLVKVARANPAFRQESNVNDLIKALNEKTTEDSYEKASERTVTSLNDPILV